MNVSHYVALACTLALAACATQGPPARVTRTGDVIRIDGEIQGQTAHEFRALLSGSPPRRVQIASGGGSVPEAIEIATLIFDQGMEIEVTGGCFSSCANYVFPAGRRKVIDAQGIVGWHGNVEHLLWLDQHGAQALSVSARPEIIDIVRKEHEFFAHIGVNGFVCWFGKIEPYNTLNLYFLLPEDMARFGIRNVEVRADYASTDVSGFLMDGKANLRLLQIGAADFKAVAPEIELR